MGGAQLWMGLLRSSGPRIAAAVILLLLAVGLWGRLRSARRAALVALLAGAVLQLYQMFQTEIVISRFIWILAPLWCWWVIWQNGDVADTADVTDADRRRNATGLVALLGRLPSLTEQDVVAAASRAFAGRGGRIPSVVGGGQFWAVRIEDLLLRVSMAARPYVNPAGDLPATMGQDARAGIGRHAAWLAVDLSDQGTADAATATAAVRRLLAELIAEDVDAIVNAQVTQAIGGGANWRQRLDAIDPQPPVPAAPTPPPPAPARDSL